METMRDQMITRIQRFGERKAFSARLRQIRATARTGLYSLSLTEPPRRVATTTRESRPVGNDPFRE